MSHVVYSEMLTRTVFFPTIRNVAPFKIILRRLLLQTTPSAYGRGDIGTTGTFDTDIFITSSKSCNGNKEVLRGWGCTLALVIIHGESEV